MVHVQIALSILTLYLAWLGWKTLALDNCRDQLFDIRQQLRQHFLERGEQLDHPVYQSLRDMLNSHIRFTEDFSLTNVVIILHALKKANAALAVPQEYLNRTSQFNDIICHTREESLRVLGKYLVQTSVILSTISLAYAFLNLFRRYRKHPRDPFQKVSGKVIKPSEGNATFRL